MKTILIKRELNEEDVIELYNSKKEALKRKKIMLHMSISEKVKRQICITIEKLEKRKEVK